MVYIKYNIVKNDFFTIFVSHKQKQNMNANRTKRLRTKRKSNRFIGEIRFNFYLKDILKEMSIEF